MTVDSLEMQVCTSHYVAAPIITRSSADADNALDAKEAVPNK